MPSIIGTVAVTVSGAGLRFFDRLRLRWWQLVEILACDVRLPAFVNAGAFVEVALSVADFDFEQGSGAPRLVL